MQKAGALEIARVPAIYVFPTVKDGIIFIDTSVVNEYRANILLCSEKICTNLKKLWIS